MPFAAKSAELIFGLQIRGGADFRRQTSCLSFQRGVLLLLDADRSLVRHVETHPVNPTYQGRARGLGARLDYRKRRW